MKPRFFSLNSDFFFKLQFKAILLSPFIPYLFPAWGLEFLGVGFFGDFFFFFGKSKGEQDAFLLRGDGGWWRPSSERGQESHGRVIIRLPGYVGESRELAGS